jgi:hypothetical protein
VIDFTLDTSGAIRTTSPPNNIHHAFWSDFDPFTQGYVEALFASLIAELRESGDCLPNLNGAGISFGVGFSDLSPEALALILRDCAAIKEALGCELDARDGREIWNDRAKRFPGGSLALYMRNRFPPLRVFLSDEGRICLEPQT